MDSETPVLVDFWAPWCRGACHAIWFAPVIEEIVKEYHGKLKGCKIDVDKAPKTASGYGIMSIPTLTIFKNGKALNKILGAVPKTEIEVAIRPYI